MVWMQYLYEEINIEKTVIKTQKFDLLKKKFFKSKKTKTLKNIFFTPNHRYALLIKVFWMTSLWPGLCADILLSTWQSVHLVTEFWYFSHIDMEFYCIREVQMLMIFYYSVLLVCWIVNYCGLYVRYLLI